MTTPLPPELVEVERLLEETRAPLPPDLLERVLRAAARAIPAARPLTFGWFAAAAAVAAAVLVNLAGTTLARPQPAAAPGPDRCAVARALHQLPEACLPADPAAR